MKKKKIIYVLLSFILIASTILGLMYFDIIDIKPKQEEIVVEPVNEPEVVIEKQEGREKWLENKAINKDYQGEIVFESGIINKSFVQAKSVYDENGNLYHFYTERGKLVTNPGDYTGNDVYIWTNWKDFTYDYDILGGSVFMDYRDSLTDQNILIHGHHFSVQNGHDPKREKAFTPLELLLDEENYEANKYVDLILDNQTNRYELVGVYIFNSSSDYDYDHLQYWRYEYNYDDFTDVIDEDYYSKYIDEFNKKKLYDTGIELTTQDKTLTLNTCIGGSNTKHEICVFRLIETKTY